MSRPGVEVSLLDYPGAVISAPTDTGVWFVVGLAERGPTTPVRVTSLSNFVANFGNRQSYSILYDALEIYFREGGDSAYIARVVGPAATTGTLALKDVGNANSLIVTAIGPGSWSSGYEVEVVAGSVGGTYDIQVQLVADHSLLEDSGNLTTQQDAIVWALGSKYVRIGLGATALPPKPAVAAPLSAGTDDRASITNADYTAALTRFTRDLGPGQVSIPGLTNSSSLVIAHAEDNNRVALCDLPDNFTLATVEAAVGRSRFAASFAPWVVIPGLTGGSTRNVPPSALVAGLLARNDPTLGANHPAAGNAGISRYAIGLSQPGWIDDDRETLNNNSVNVIRNIYGSIVVYGWRSGANPLTDANWIDFGNARFFMKLSAELNQVGQNFMFEEIDGQNGRTIGAFHDSLSGVMVEHWNAGELFGDKPEDSFFVDTGPEVNTLVTIANLELHAIVYVKMAPFAEWVQIQIVKQAIA